MAHVYTTGLSSSKSDFVLTLHLIPTNREPIIQTKHQWTSVNLLDFNRTSWPQEIKPFGDGFGLEARLPAAKDG